jgi:hypothetical protein
MGWREVAEIHRTSAIKKHGLVVRRNKDLKELNLQQAEERKQMFARHKLEDAAIRKWFNDEMQLEAEYVADAIVGAQR